MRKLYSLLVVLLSVLSCSLQNEKQESTKCFPYIESYNIYAKNPDAESYISDWIKSKTYPPQMDSSEFALLLQIKGYMNNTTTNKEK